ncbi:zinc finger protein ZPR1-like [Lingula anatina]|uniref:Zinc finger protein ZPR1-like n=1 Tax=Lingula anatina TaxID=7574 RepID=A0A1S3HNK5_LINAN|nr:zinc finger protein ZPR1-like [Lingula anatina]|eukprot:XP_013387638.1 zinc finger protein ZPR1-like [Lingula anatina]
MSENTEEQALAEKNGPIFLNINPDDDAPFHEIESLCLNCHEQGTTRLMLTKIPFFKDVIVSSFSCDQCGHQDSEIQSAGPIQERGVILKLTVAAKQDLNRQVVLSNTATMSIPSLEFEAPPNKGLLTTVEGVITRAVDGLQQNQPVRKAIDPDTAAKIDEFITKLEKLKDLEKPFIFLVNDPSGNSYIENPSALTADPGLTVTKYTRNLEQNKLLGILPDDATENIEPEAEEAAAEANLKDEVLQFRSNCPNCNSPCDTNMKLVDIPNFKQVVIMATVCDVCGAKDNEVKGGAGIEPKGIKISLHLTDPSDLSRDLLKSDTCGLEIPELELTLEHGTLGGKFTTVEGILTDIKGQLGEENPFISGDSSQSDTRNKVQEFCARLEEIISGKRLDVHIILDDPAGNSYIQNVYAPEPDPEMTVEHYDRNYDQNEILGLNDMQTENYES